MKRFIILLCAMYGITLNLNSMIVSHNDNWLESLGIRYVYELSEDGNKESYNAHVIDPNNNYEEFTIYSSQDRCYNEGKFVAKEIRIGQASRTIVNPLPQRVFYFLKARRHG